MKPAAPETTIRKRTPLSMLIVSGSAVLQYSRRSALWKLSRADGETIVLAGSLIARSVGLFWRRVPQGGGRASARAPRRRISHLRPLGPRIRAVRLGGAAAGARSSASGRCRASRTPSSSGASARSRWSPEPPRGGLRRRRARPGAAFGRAYYVVRGGVRGGGGGVHRGAVCPPLFRAAAWLGQGLAGIRRHRGPDLSS